VQVLGISGSLRSGSHNSALLRAAATVLPFGVEMSIFTQLEAIPSFNEDRLEPRPPAEQALRDAIVQADGVLIATPEYNSSIPGVLKNALDWLSRPLLESPIRNKPVLVIGASTSMFGAVWAQAETRKVLSAIGARVIDTELPVAAAADRFDEHGMLVDQGIERKLSRAVAGLAEAIAARADSTAG
jgi:chromate reductase, NAD(P)H dehydrogenase (quinone)